MITIPQRTSLTCARPGSAPFFHPWIGSAACGSDGVRWHVLGESHYSRPGENSYDETPDLTRQVVRDWAFDRSPGSAFFTRVASVIKNQPPEVVERPAAWNAIAYSNFVQRMLDEPRKAPPANLLKAAREAFVAQLYLTGPEVLVVLGSRLWEQLPADNCVKLPPFKFDVEPDWPPVSDAWLYATRRAQGICFTIAVKIVHPSAGYGRWNWQVAAQRAHTAAMCHSNIVEFVCDNYEIL